MGSSQGKKCLVIIHYYYYLSSVSYCYIYVGENNTFLSLNKSTDVPLASSASNEKKMNDSSQICDYRFLSIIITNQLRNIEYYRVLLINQLSFR